MDKRLHIRLKLAFADFSVDVSLDVPGQGVTALFGHSGSGKTTCLRCVAGLEQAPEAFIEVNGEVWQDSRRGIFVPTHKRALGYVFQEASLFAHLTVMDNLQFGLRRIPQTQQKVRIAQAIELMGIDHLLARRPDKLSGGERQRIGIARALLTSPRLLLLDEPLAALDARRKAEILPYLERLQAELRIPMLYVSHSQDEVARLADHLVLLSEGRVMASGTLQAMLARLDLPMALEADAGVVIEGVVADFNPHYHLLTLDLPGCDQPMRIAHGPLAPGSRLRFKVQARDVSLTRHPDEHSSILNRLPVTVVGQAPAEHPAHVQVLLDASGTPLLARITRYSSDQLQLHPGQPLWAQIKSVAVLA
ncbi:molybdenum ABC transporter ATP-binding protein [Pseudomonas syringae]|nr:molybdenum ABC transporter ATP-binding protein [Pseudomonas syringae]MBD8790270.1 molybdenum ABC transporter ATP-binding protein [Pseudomonas syringae]MBD8799232.1 molybdenum ABC transporter ATP-binding protein [Pseudomonas syringae]MBD8810058.1 molybdenum ABC transporter ATP-binding protein [Pseudomonas syringae]